MKIGSEWRLGSAKLKEEKEEVIEVEKLEGKNDILDRVNKKNHDAKWNRDKLRKIHVSDSKQEDQCYDISILSLDLKVNKSEEERELSFQDNELDSWENQI